MHNNNVSTGISLAPPDEGDASPEAQRIESLVDLGEAEIDRQVELHFDRETQNELAAWGSANLPRDQKIALNAEIESADSDRIVSAYHKIAAAREGHSAASSPAASSGPAKDLAEFQTLQAAASRGDESAIARINATPIEKIESWVH